MVLDSRVRNQSRALHFLDAGHRFPDLLYNFRTSHCSHFTNRRGVIGLVHCALFFRWDIVSLKLVSHASCNNSWHFLTQCVYFSDGVLQPFEQLSWWKWVYRVSPFTYLVEGLLGQGIFLQAFRLHSLLMPALAAVGHQQIQCSPVEFSVVNPPSGLTCYTYLSTFIDNFGGYVNNPEATRLCQYCPARTTDEFLEGNFNIFYAHRWRNVAIVLGASLFNVSKSVKKRVCILKSCDRRFFFCIRLLIFSESAEVFSVLENAKEWFFIEKSYHQSAYLFSCSVNIGFGRLQLVLTVSLGSNTHSFRRIFLWPTLIPSDLVPSSFPHILDSTGALSILDSVITFKTTLLPLSYTCDITSHCRSSSPGLSSILSTRLAQSLL